MEPTHFTLGLFGKQKYLLALVSFSVLPSINHKKNSPSPTKLLTVLCALCTDSLLHKAIVSSFSSYGGPEQKQNWDVNHERGIATRQLFQLCQIPFVCTDSDSFPLLSLLSAKMPLISKTRGKEIFSLASPSQGIQLERRNRTSSGKRETKRGQWAGKADGRQRKNAQEEGQQLEKQMSSWSQLLTAVMEIWIAGDSLVLILVFPHTSLHITEKTQAPHWRSCLFIET